MVTASPSIHWAEALLRQGGLDALAALVRGDELFVLNLTTASEPYMEIYRLVRPGDDVGELKNVVLRVEEGTIVFGCRHWLNDVWPPDELLDVSECLLQARLLLDTYTEPDERLARNIELIRWSTMASSGDFSSLDELEPPPGAD